MTNSENLLHVDESFTIEAHFYAFGIGAKRFRVFTQCIEWLADFETALH